MKKILLIFLLAVIPVQANFGDGEFDYSEYYTPDEVDALLNLIDYAFVTGNDVLTDILAAELETLTDGSDTGLHIHDRFYYTETELGATSSPSGASQIGIEDAMSLYIATDVEAALEEVKDLVTVVVYAADSIVTTPSGLTVGSVSDIQTINDGNVYTITETNGAPNPNFTTVITYTGIGTGHEANKIQLHYSYNGVAGHNVTLEIENSPYDDSVWDSVDTLTQTAGVLTFLDVDIPGTITDYNNSGTTKIRIIHNNNGNNAHDFVIDYAVILDDPAGMGGITDHGQLSGLSDDDHTQYLLADGDTMTGPLNMDGNTITSGNITIFDVTPVLVFKDSNNTGAASIGFIEWRDSANTRLGFLGNSTNQNDDFLWKNEQGGNIGIQTTGAGELQIFAPVNLFGQDITGVGNLGIGVVAPDAKLHIFGSDARLRIQDDDASTDYFEIDDAGSSQATMKKVSASGNMVMDWDFVTGDNSNVAFRVFRSTITTGTKKMQFFKGDGSNTPQAQIGVDGEDSYFQIGDGNVGIGKTDPQVALDVVGTIKATTQLTTDLWAAIDGGDINNQWTGQQEGYVLINGTNDSVSLANDGPLDFTSNFSISVWVYRENNDLSDIVIRYDGANLNYSLLHLGGNYRFYVGAFGANDFAVTTNPTAEDTWFHLGAVSDGTDTILYLNGVRQTDAIDNPPSGPQAVNTPTLVGLREDGLRDFTGRVSDLMFFTSALSVSEMNAIYDIGIASPSGHNIPAYTHDDLIRWWKFTQNSNDALAGQVGTLTSGAAIVVTDTLDFTLSHSLLVTDNITTGGSGTFGSNLFATGNISTDDGDITTISGDIITADGAIRGNDLVIDEAVIFSALPISDPTNAGQVWNDSGTLKISAGP